MKRTEILLLACVLLTPANGFAEEPAVKQVVARVVQSAGGEDNILRLFRARERLNVSSDPMKKATDRVSVLEPPRYWWLGKRERVSQEKEPAIYLVWAWTLAALTDADSKVELIANIVDEERPLYGLRVSGTIDPPLDMYFDPSQNRLARIDWRADIHRFSDWKEHDGAAYPSKCAGYKKTTGKPWYFTEIIELERLKELPDGLKRLE